MRAGITRIRYHVKSKKRIGRKNEKSADTVMLLMLFERDQQLAAEIP